MSAESELRVFLLADAAIQALGTKMYPSFVPEGGTVPAIVYQQIITLREYTHAGQAELLSPRFQLSCWDTTPNKAFTLAMLVIDRLRDYDFHVAVVNEIHDGQSKEELGTPTDRYRVLLDVQVFATEAVT